MYALKELFDMAVQIEIAGEEYYSRCAEEFTEPAIEKMFHFLANEERKHRDTFEAMAKDMGQLEGNFSEEYYRYLKALGSDQIFQDGDTLDRKSFRITSPAEALSEALVDEKNSILLYMELKEHVTDERSLSLLLDIIDEERYHVTRLLDMLQSLTVT